MISCWAEKHDQRHTEQGSGRPLPEQSAPGQTGMLRIKEMKIDKTINESIKKNSKILGICLGMQLLGNYSEEDGGYEGLNLIDNRVDIITKNNIIIII